jgi:hypothetical protein
MTNGEWTSAIGSAFFYTEGKGNLSAFLYNKE